MSLQLSEFSTPQILDEFFLAILLVPKIEMAIWNSTKRAKYKLLLKIIQSRGLSSPITNIQIVPVVPICDFISADYPQVVLGFLAAVKGISKTEKISCADEEKGHFMGFKQMLQNEGFGVA